jgi:hypothetical protein
VRAPFATPKPQLDADGECIGPVDAQTEADTVMQMVEGERANGWSNDPGIDEERGEYLRPQARLAVGKHTRLP